MQELPITSFGFNRADTTLLINADATSIRIGSRKGSSRP
jgi:hypothetical protein